jgi:hypothetical protein
MAFAAQERPITAKYDERTVVHFTEARLTALSNASYVELSKPEINGSLLCSFCNKTTSHEHEFAGRVKYVPGEEKYFISLILPPQTSQQEQRKKKKISKLQIIPIRDRKVVDPPSWQMKEKAAALKMPPPSVEVAPTAPRPIYPLVTMTEKEAMSIFRSALRDFLGHPDTTATSALVKAVKVLSSTLVYLLKAQVVEQRSLLKLSNSSRAKSEECGQCNDLAFVNVTDYLQHFRGGFHLPFLPSVFAFAMLQ